MNFRLIRQLVGVRDMRNAAIGIFIVFGGLALAALTLHAQRTQNAALAGVAAGASLVFVLLLLIFVVPSLVRNAGREMSQLNLPFELTVGGFIYVGLVAVVGFSAWSSGNNLLFLVLSFMTAGIVVGLFAGNASLKKLEVRIRFPDSIFAGETARIAVSLKNRKVFLPVFSAQVEVRGREREKSAAAADLEKILPKRIARRVARPPLARRTLEYFEFVARRSTTDSISEQTFARRGRFIIEDFEVSTRFPFGFFRHRRRMTTDAAELVIFPRLHEPEMTSWNVPRDAGHVEAQRRGAGHDLLNLREYQAHDDLRRIDWKATARLRSLTVREFSADDAGRIVVIFDPRTGETAPQRSIRQQLEAEKSIDGVSISERFELGASIAASLLTHYFDRQSEICLVIGDEIGGFGLGRSHLRTCLRRLALAEPRFTTPLPVSELVAQVAEGTQLFANCSINVVTAAEVDRDIGRLNAAVFSY